MEKTNQFQQNAGVFAVNGQRLGQLERVVFDPETRVITHIVVSHGGLVDKEQRVVPIDLVAETTENQIALRSEAEDLGALPVFEMPHYVPKSEQAPEPSGSDIAAVPNPPYGTPMIAVPARPLPPDQVSDQVVATQTDRNIPHGTVAMKEGARVITREGKEAGEVERVVADSQIGQITHLLISSGLLDRFPRLKFVSVESGIGWLPFMLESLDYQFVENGVDDLKLRPTEYFRRQIYGSYWFESNPKPAIDWIGEDNLMFETDFPHATCLYPAVKETKERSLRGLDPRVQRKLLYENAAKVYQLSL